MKLFDFRPSARTNELSEALQAFLDEVIYPEEQELRAKGSETPELRQLHPPLIEALQKEARDRGLWNCLVRGKDWGTDMGYLEAAPLAEITGKSWLLPRAINWCGPDHGNIELLIEYGNKEQKAQWLPGLLESEYGSCFAMTEPAVASSDASNIETTIHQDGDEFVINGRKWWISAADEERTKLAIVLGVSEGADDSHGRHSTVLVPMNTPGITVERSLSVMGYGEAGGQMLFENVRVPMANLLGEKGKGFVMAQERLAPVRVYHAMRSVGMAERSMELMLKRANERVVFGSPIGEHGMAQREIALSRIEIDATRLLVLQAAAMVDELGAKGAMTAIAEVKVAAPAMAIRVIDRAIQIHGGGGLSSDFPFGWMHAMSRVIRIADGPDEVHLRSIARRELKAARVGSPRTLTDVD